MSELGLNSDLGPENEALNRREEPDLIQTADDNLEIDREKLIEHIGLLQDFFERCVDEIAEANEGESLTLEFADKLASWFYEQLPRIIDPTRELEVIENECHKLIANWLYVATLQLQLEETRVQMVQGTKLSKEDFFAYNRAKRVCARWNHTAVHALVKDEVLGDAMSDLIASLLLKGYELFEQLDRIHRLDLARRRYSGILAEAMVWKQLKQEGLKVVATKSSLDVSHDIDLLVHRPYEEIEVGGKVKVLAVQVKSDGVYLKDEPAVTIERVTKELPGNERKREDMYSGIKHHLEKIQAAEFEVIFADLRVKMTSDFLPHDLQTENEREALESPYWPKPDMSGMSLMELHSYLDPETD